MKETQARVKKRSEERDDLETIKAVAWAVFQHNNGGGCNSNRHFGAVLVHQATRFKIEAQMKNELERRSMTKEALPSWDAGSTLFDTYELNSVFKHLDIAFQSVDTQQNAPSDGSEYYDETTAESAPTHGVGNNQCTHQQHSREDQTLRIGYGNSESAKINRQNWLETVNESQRFRGNYLESVDESLPLADALNAGYGEDVLDYYRYEESPKPKPVTNMDAYDDLYKDAQEVAPQGKVLKTMPLMHTSNRWSVLNGRRCSFDTSPDDVQKDRKRSRKSKLLSIFRPKSGKDGSTPKSMRQARIVPDDSSQKGRKPKTEDALRRSGELVVAKILADSHDSDSSDSTNGDGYDAQEYQIPTLGSKIGLQKVVAQNFSRAVRLSSDMSNPNPEEGLRNHIRHGDLTYGHSQSVPASPTGRKKTSYSLNVTSPVQTPRRSMLNGSREDFDSEGMVVEFHHHYHHHHHHIAHEDDDYELTVQDIEKRVPRKSFEEMTRRLSIEETRGMTAPRNSLESPFHYTPTTPGSKLFL